MGPAAETHRRHVPELQRRQDHPGVHPEASLQRRAGPPPIPSQPAPPIPPTNQESRGRQDARILEGTRSDNQQEGERLDRIEQERKRKLKEANDFNKRQVEQVITSTGPVVSEQPYMFGSVYEREREKRRAFEKEMMQFYQ